MTTMTTKDGIIRIENPNEEHWYWSETLKKWLPSVTTITGVYPKGDGFARWMGAQESYETAIEERDKAGDRGTRFHKTCEAILGGSTVTFASYRDDNALEMITAVYEWKMVEGFVNFLNDKKPKVLKVEQRVLNEEIGYGGTVDAVMEIDGEKFVIDFKTSSGLYFSHEMQVEAYRSAIAYMDSMGIMDMGPGLENDPEDFELALLHLKTKNECGYSFKDLRPTPRRKSQKTKDELWANFLACKTIWESFDGRDGPETLELQESVSYPQSP